MRRAPAAWIAAAAFAALPLAVVFLKPASPAVAPTATPAAVPQSAEQPGWFESADNPFLTEDQARERRLRQAVARVEDVVRRRPDVTSVSLMARAEGKGQPVTAVAIIRMREGAVPVAVVDAVGSLLSASVSGLRPEDVTVIDEPTGIRARAASLDEAAATRGREALASAEAAPRRLEAWTAVVAVEPVPNASWAGAETWIALAAAASIAAVAAWWWTRRRGSLPSAAAAEEDPIAGTLAMAMHRSVAERGPLVTTALVERLEQGGDPREIAHLLLSLEPWAAERLLKGMPPEALGRIEEALRDTSPDASPAQVRAVAEAVLAVGSAVRT